MRRWQRKLKASSLPSSIVKMVVQEKYLSGVQMVFYVDNNLKSIVD
ncbi:MAG: hypothetical protein ACR5LA_12375 [Wolbachia sp.]